MARVDFRRFIAHMLMVAALLISGLAGFHGVAQAAPQQPDATGVVSSQAAGIQVAAARPWTAEEMRAAKPYPVQRARGGAGKQPPPDAAAAAQGTGSSIPGSQPTKSPDAIGLLGSGEVGSYASYPYSTVGKLFFNQNGGSYVCSAAVIKRQSIWTAGHCVHAGNNSSASWSTNVVFVPQYFDGSAPLGQWAVPVLWTTWDWYTYGNPNGLDQDYAGGILNGYLGDYTGWLGLAWNQSYNQYYIFVGYPQAAPYTGGRMIYCDSGLAYYGFGSPTTYGIFCPMTGGSSGGPGIILGSYLNGNVSYGSSAGSGIMVTGIRLEMGGYHDSATLPQMWEHHYR